MGFVLWRCFLTPEDLLRLPPPGPRQGDRVAFSPPGSERMILEASALGPFQFRLPLLGDLSCARLYLEPPAQRLGHWGLGDAAGSVDVRT